MMKDSIRTKGDGSVADASLRAVSVTIEDLDDGMAHVAVYRADGDRFVFTVSPDGKGGIALLMPEGSIGSLRDEGWER